MITYRFFFEGLITEFGNKLPDRFFPWGPIFEFGNNYRPVFSPGEPFSSQVKNAWNRFYSPGVPFLSQVKIPETGCAEFIVYIYTFSDFLL